jgi:hypothetical protein
MCRPGIEALFVFAAGLFEPLAVGADLAWFDLTGHCESGYPPHMEWRLVRRDQAARLSRSWPVATTLEEVDEVDVPTLEQFLARACAQEGAPELFACPMWIGFTEVRARLFDPMAPDVSELRLGRKQGPATTTIERRDGALWVKGPRDGFITTPVTASLQVGPYELAVEVVAHWTPWSQEDRPGTRAVEAAVARVATLGWELEE